jgi:S-adenosylmethionine-diacylglycerol 3-amino-3-carboxypropyl transferase
LRSFYGIGGIDMASGEARAAIRQAVRREVGTRRQAVLDRLFALWFARFVYNQIWEDPAIDLEALEVGPGHRIVTIASGGCNILNYLVADPAQIDAVDLNPAHIALTRLKLAAMRNLPDHDAFFRFFGVAKNKENVDLYWQHLSQRLDPATRQFWERRSLLGRPRIEFFAKGLYRQALLGKFIGFLHGVARIADRRPSQLLDATSLEEQRAIFTREIEPLFELKLVRLLCRQPILLYSLGIPASQFEQMKKDSDGDLARLYQDRIRRLACDFSLDENYFAWQAFGRHYDVEQRRATPPYLKADNFAPIRERLDRVRTHQCSMTDYLRTQEPGSIDRFVLLDSVDWMDQRTLTELWVEIRRAASPEARVIFRTAGSASPFETMIEPSLLQAWRYHAQESRAWLERDRAAIYGGFHLYSHAA